MQIEELQSSAAQLLQQFAVYGRYYQKLIGGVQEQLRDRLEIAPRSWSLQHVLAHTPDLLVVMMNPGASRPLGALWAEEGSHGFTEALPDRTQYQIMRLLLAARHTAAPWQHARVLNLSDLRTPQSAELQKKLQRYRDDESHSVFSAERQPECTELFANTSIPVLCAWGLNPRLIPWAHRALQAARGHTLYGLTQDGVLYKHPLPQRFDLQQQWLTQVVQQTASPDI
jgi:hypothetical protein